MTWHQGEQGEVTGQSVKDGQDIYIWVFHNRQSTSVRAMKPLARRQGRTTRRGEHLHPAVLAVILGFDLIHVSFSATTLTP